MPIRAFFLLVFSLKGPSIRDERVLRKEEKMKCEVLMAKDKVFVITKVDSCNYTILVAAGKDGQKSSHVYNAFDDMSFAEFEEMQAVRVARKQAIKSR